MRFLPWLFMMLATASAQTDVGKLLEQGMSQALSSLTPVPEPDKSEVLRATADLLTKHVTFRPDGTASAIYTASGRQQVEWKNILLRAHTTVSNAWIAERMAMGHPGSVSRAVSEGRTDKQILKSVKEMERMLIRVL